MGRLRRFTAVLTALVALGETAAAADATGVWLRTDGEARVRIASCGGALCGSIVWLRQAGSPAKIGQRVFYGMRPAGANRWSGSAFNPEDGRTYSGTMVLAGDMLTTSGCVLGGLICRSVAWSRAR